MATLAKSDFVAPVAVARPRFFVNAAAVCLAIGVIGFAPTYWVPLLTGRLEIAPLAHLHALAFYGWLILFLRQSQLAASREIGRHRELGVAGVALGTAMCFFGFGMAALSIREGEAAGFGEGARAFAIVPFTGIALFAALFVVALRNIARPEIHKRLMFVNTAQMLQAAVGRWFLLAFAPALPSATTVLQPPPVAVTIGPALVVASARKPMCARRRALPASQGFGSTKQPDSCSLKKSFRFCATETDMNISPSFH